MAWAAAGAILLVGLLSLYNRRAAMILLAAVAAISGIIGIAIELQPSIRENAKEAVVATASVDPAACPDPASPIKVEFRNDNDGALQRLSFSLIGRLEGHSSIAYRGFLRDDKIIEPGGSTVTCYGLLPHGFAAPRPDAIRPLDYEWSVDISLVDFQPQ
jgi:hypothetical protein